MNKNAKVNSMADRDIFSQKEAAEARRKATLLPRALDPAPAAAKEYTADERNGFYCTFGDIVETLERIVEAALKQMEKAEALPDLFRSQSPCHSVRAFLAIRKQVVTEEKLTTKKILFHHPSTTYSVTHVFHIHKKRLRA